MLHQSDFAFSFSVLSAGSFNDLATAYMAFPDRTISHLFSLGSLTPQVLTDMPTLWASLPHQHLAITRIHTLTLFRSTVMVPCGMLLRA